MANAVRSSSAAGAPLSPAAAKELREVGHTRFPLMDSLRAIAALSVLAYHAADPAHIGKTLAPYTRWLGEGVTIFFVLSGFLLYRPYVAARLSAKPKPDTVNYAWRRVLRIVPAYWLALTVYAIWFGKGIFGANALTYYGFAQIYNGSTILGGIPQAWTLGVEIAFYAFLPIFATLLGLIPVSSRRGRFRVELIALAALVGFCTWYQLDVALGIRTYSIFPRPEAAVLPRYIDQFALGMLLAVVSVWLQGRRLPRGLRWLNLHPGIAWGAAAVLSWYAITQPASDWKFDQMQRHWLQALVAMLLVLPAVLGNQRRGLVRRILANRVLLWLGIISYGIYLWHVGVIDQLDSWGLPQLGPGLVSFVAWALIAAIPTIAIAAVSWYVLERHALSLKRIDPRRFLFTDRGLPRLGSWAMLAAALVMLYAGLRGTGRTAVDVVLVAAGLVALTAPGLAQAARARGLELRGPAFVAGAGGAALLAILLALSGVGNDASAGRKSSPLPPQGRPTHIVATYAPGNLTLYVNGKQVSQRPVKGVPTKSKASLEIGAYASGAQWRGTIDEVAVYARALSPLAILHHHDVGIGKQNKGSYAATVEREPGLAGYWRLDERKGMAISSSPGPSGIYARPVRRSVPGLIAGDRDRAAGFPGRRGSVVVPAPPPLDPRRGFSLEAWVAGATSDNHSILSQVGRYYLKTDYYGHIGAGVGPGAGSPVYSEDVVPVPKRSAAVDGAGGHFPIGVALLAALAALLSGWVSLSSRTVPRVVQARS